MIALDHMIDTSGPRSGDVKALGFENWGFVEFTLNFSVSAQEGEQKFNILSAISI